MDNNNPAVRKFRNALTPIFRNLTLTEVNLRTGVPRSVLADLNQGKRLPTSGIVDDLASLLPADDGAELVRLYAAARRSILLEEQRMGKNGSVSGTATVGNTATHIVTHSQPGLRVGGDLNISGATVEGLQAFSGTEVGGTLNVALTPGVGKPVQVLGAAAPSLSSVLDGHANMMPDPFTAHDPEAFMAVLRDLWRFTDRVGSRKLAQRSTDPITGEPAFSHATIVGLLSEDPKKWPKIRLAYIQGFVRAVGGDKTLIGRWSVAWRHVFEGFPLPVPVTEPAQNDDTDAGVIPINRKPAI
ncbi:MAG: hypothetical protein ABWX68_08320 [Arthrobacter sp.]|uniref:hypothetical protein n=1 Tax=Arthrobacter sp. TaxID=1667 RepID=UPI00346BFF23